MKMDARRVDGVLRDPGAFQVVLLYGDDVGLIRARGDQMTRAVAGDLHDPFLVASLERDTHHRLTEEATALPMTGGRRVVRVREATDALTGPVELALRGTPTCLLVLEAPSLPPKSRLRVLADGHEKAASIGCYPEEGRGLEATIRAVLNEARVGIDREALAWVASQLGADQALTRSEVEKLALFCGPGATADLSAAQACIGDAAAVSLDDALFSATAGDIGGTDRALSQTMAEGLAPVALLRSILLHLQRLHRASLVVAEGRDPTEVMNGLRPPLFRRRQRPFLRALDLWHPADLIAVMDAVFTAEQACKRTAAPAEAIGEHVVLGIARRAARLAWVSRGPAG